MASERLAYLRPSHSVPVTRWRSSSRWRTRPASFIVVVVGQWIFGTGEALLVASGLGVAPWTVLSQGLSNRLPISLGVATLLVSVLVLLLWLPLREWPGLGTVCNVLVIATALQIMVTVIPVPSALAARLAFVLGGIVIIGIGSGLYLTANLGPGPRDGWMTGIHQRTGWPISGVRLAIEAFVLVLGWTLGGTVGIGTVLFAVLIGPSVGYGLRLAGHLGHADGRAVEEGEHPELEA